MDPRLIYVTASAFGPQGPDGSRPGVKVAAQAAGGLSATTGQTGDKEDFITHRRDLWTTWSHPRMDPLEH